MKVPGDPGNQGVASPVFAVEVTPAPPAALTPGGAGQLIAAVEGQSRSRRSERKFPSALRPSLGAAAAALQAATARACRCAPTLRLTRCRALSTVLRVAAPAARRPARRSSRRGTATARGSRAPRGRVDRQPTSERSSSEEITWLTGSWTVGPGQHLVERRLVVAGAGGRGGERHVLVQRRVLVARRGLDGRDDLARDAELGEVAEARLAVGAEVADRLVEADQPLLDEVVGVAAGEEVRRGLQAHEAVVAPDEPVVCVAIALLGEGDQITILDLRFRVRVMGDSCHEQILSRALHAGQAPNVLSGALLPWRQSYRVLRLLNLRFSVMWARASHSYGELVKGRRSALCKISYRMHRRGGADVERLDPPAQRQRDQLVARLATRGRRPRPRCRARAPRPRRRSPGSS